MFAMCPSCYDKQQTSPTDDGNLDVSDTGTGTGAVQNGSDREAAVYDALVDPHRNSGQSIGVDAEDIEEIHPIEGYIDESRSRHDQMAELYLPLKLSEETGWRESTEMFCTVSTVWSDGSGVFGFGEITPDSDTGQSLHFNDGTGWSQLCESVPVSIDNRTLDTPPAAERTNITALSNTKYLLWNMGIPDGILSLTIGSAPCELDLEFATESYVRDLFVVNENLAYALLEHGIIQYDGTGWSRLSGTETETGFESENSLWANEETLVFIDEKAQVAFYNKREKRMEQNGELPVGNYTTVWGFNNNDIWAGNSGNQLVHYDGKSWEVFWTGDFPTDGIGIKMMWGMDQKLFFAGDRHLGVYDGQQVELLARWSSSQDSVRLLDMWGNSPNEVFFTFNSGPSACEAGLLWYDGSDFRRF